MKRRIVKTSDGSHSLYVEELNEHYHSYHGAVQESRHVFVRKGLEYFEGKKDLRVFEMGFGTGLNALLAWDYAENQEIKISYLGIEAFPVKAEEIRELNYAGFIDREGAFEVFERMHAAEWGVVEAFGRMEFEKQQVRLDEAEPEVAYFDVIFFDAFAPEKQPELWTEEVFKKMHRLLAAGGILVTYCAKGAVKRTMKAAGFRVESLPGPPGKREMIRAVKD